MAYDVHEQADGSLEILTYNPNTPYSSAEETDNTARLNATFASTITVTSDGRWSGGIFTGGDLTKPWTGGMSTIEVIDRMPPGDADLPFGFFTHSLDADDGVAEVTGIEAGGKQALRPDGTAIPGTGVSDLVRPSGDHSPIDYRLDPGRSYAFTVTGTGDGTFGDGLLGGRAGSEGAGAADRQGGQEDHVDLTPGAARLKLDPGGASSPATLKLLDRTGKASTQTADVSLSARHGSTESASLSGGAMSLRHTGPATSATVTLGALGYGAPPRSPRSRSGSAGASG